MAGPMLDYLQGIQSPWLAKGPLVRVQIPVPATATGTDATGGQQTLPCQAAIRGDAVSSIYDLTAGGPVAVGGTLQPVVLVTGQLQQVGLNLSGHALQVQLLRLDGSGKKYQRTLAAFGQVADQFRAQTGFGCAETMIAECQPDAYAYHLRNSNLQIIDGEAPATTLVALENRWQQWHESGGVEGVEAALLRLGFSNTAVWSTADLVIAGATNPFGLQQNWFFVIIGEPNPWTLGDQWAGGQKWAGNPVGRFPPLWGLGGSRVLLDEVVATIQKFKHGCSSCRFVVIALDSTFAFDPTTFPYFTGAYVIRPVWEAWESQVTGNGHPNENYNFGFWVQ